MYYLSLGPRIILDPYRGINQWSPHVPLLGVIYDTHHSKGRIASPWKDNYAYTLGVL